MTQNKTSKFVFAPTAPIYIEDSTITNYKQPSKTVATLSLFPAFQVHQSITPLLYSKFIVKGVRPINQESIKDKLRACTSQKKYRKTTHQTTNCTRQVIVKQKSNHGRSSAHHRNVSQNDEKPQYPKQRILHRKGRSESQSQQYQPQGFQRSSVFGRPQSAVPKSLALKINTRPQSANTQRPRSASTTITKRPQTALTRKFSQQVLTQRYEYSAEKGNQLMTISESHPNLQVDYVQKNKRQISSAKKSIYLTNFDRPGSSTRKKKDPVETHESPSMKREAITPKQKKQIADKQRNYLKFMKENMPQQYQQCIEYLNKNYEQLDQQRSLLSCSLAEEKPFELTAAQVQQFEVQHFYQTFLNKCLNTESAIKRTQPQKAVTEYISHILNFDDCVQILSMYREIEQCREKNIEYHGLNDKIKKIVQILLFFQELKPQIMKKVFQMNYQIVEIQEEEPIINKNNPVKHVYIILNGSVSKQQANDIDLDLQATPPPQFISSLFDGQLFGLPNKIHEQTYNYSVRTVQKCLLMVLPFTQYRRALSSNQNISDRIQLLRRTFSSRKGPSKLTNEDYQTMAYQMQTVSYQSQQIIAREGQPNNNLMLVASGGLKICFESIIKRNKANCDPLLKKRKEQRRVPQISELRKTNVVNYELLLQNQREMYYYKIQPYEEKVRSDVLNWKGFHTSIHTRSQDQQFSLPYSIITTRNDTKIYLLSFAKLSKLSEHILKQIVQTATENAGRDSIMREQTDLNKWQAYKIKICDEIVKKKGKVC